MEIQKKKKKKPSAFDSRCRRETPKAQIMWRRHAGFSFSSFSPFSHAIATRCFCGRGSMTTARAAMSRKLAKAEAIEGMESSAPLVAPQVQESWSNSIAFLVSLPFPLFLYLSISLSLYPSPSIPLSFSLYPSLSLPLPSYHLVLDGRFLPENLKREPENAGKLMYSALESNLVKLFRSF